LSFELSKLTKNVNAISSFFLIFSSLGCTAKIPLRDSMLVENLSSRNLKKIATFVHPFRGRKKAGGARWKKRSFKQKT
jgi:hypothetical protein